MFTHKKTAIALAVAALLGDATIALAATAAVAIGGAQSMTQEAGSATFMQTAETDCETSLAYPWPFGACPPAGDITMPAVALSETADQGEAMTRQN